MAKSNDTFSKTLTVVVGLCLVCSLVVSFAAVSLKKQQQTNKEQDTQKYILEAAGLLDKANGDIPGTFAKYIEARVIEFDTGEYVTDIDPLKFDPRRAARDPKQSSRPENDIASISRRADRGLVYLVNTPEGEVDRVILPIHGYGLWSTMYAFLALDPGFSTVQKLVYYEQGETPGLGAEVENPKWKAQWPGKKLFGKNGEIKIRVVKGGAKPGDDYGVDGLSGATLTANGVQNSLLFWLGEEGYAPYIAKTRTGASTNG